MSSSGEREADFRRRVAELDRAHARHKTRRYFSLVLHWLASAVGSPRPVNIDPLPKVARSQISVTFIGHASVLLRYANLRVVIDPMLGNRLGPLGLVRRELAPGIDPASLDDVDVVLISNPSPAHLHVPTLATIRRAATVILPSGYSQKISHLGFDQVLELAPDQGLSVDGVTIHTTSVSTDGSSGLGFVLRGDGPTVFACGRSGYCSAFREVGERHHPDLAILPIGGFCPSSFRRRHLSPLDALYAFEDLRARLLIPVHFGAFPLSYERLGEPPRWLADLVTDRRLEGFVVPLAPGESRLFTNPARAKRPTPHAQLLSSGLVIGNGPALAL